MTEDNLTQLLTTYIQMTGELRALVKDGFIQLNEKLDANLNELRQIQGQVEELKNRVTVLERQDTPVPSLPVPVYPHSTAEDNPFAQQLITRTVLQPPGRNGTSLQFRWDLYEALGKEVLTKQLNLPWHEKYYVTFKKNSLHYADGLVDSLRQQHHLASNITWDAVPKALQRQAIKVLEDTIGDEYPLKACVDSWGARLLMRKAFFRCKDTEG